MNILRILPIVVLSAGLLVPECSMAQQVREFRCHSTVDGTRSDSCQGRNCVSRWRITGTLNNGTCLRQDSCNRTIKDVVLRTVGHKEYQFGVKFLNDINRTDNGTDIIGIVFCSGKDRCTDHFYSEVLFNMEDCRYTDINWEPIRESEGSASHRKAVAFTWKDALRWFTDAWGIEADFGGCEEKRACSRALYEEKIQLAKGAVSFSKNDSKKPSDPVSNAKSPSPSLTLAERPLFAAICYMVAMTTALSVLLFCWGKLRYSRSPEALAEAAAAADAAAQAAKSRKEAGVLVNCLGDGSTLSKRLQVGNMCTGGAFSTTSHCTWKPANREQPEQAAVVKFYDGGFMHSKYWVNECLLYDLFQLQHSGLLRLLEGGVQTDPVNRGVWIVFEEGYQTSIRDFLIHGGKQSISTAVGILVDAASGLAYLHDEKQQRTSLKQRIAHCHLSPLSVFIRANGSACIGNLSCAVVNAHPILGLTTNTVDNLFQQSTFNFVPVCGSPRYASPEMLTGWVDAYDNFDVLQASDIYSFSLIMWEVLILSPVDFANNMVSYTQAYSHIAKPNPGMKQMHDISVKRQCRPLIPSLWHTGKVHQEVKDIMERCWSPDSDLRPKALHVHQRLKDILSAAAAVSRQRPHCTAVSDPVMTVHFSRGQTTDDTVAIHDGIL